MTEDQAKTKYCPMGGRKVDMSSGQLSVGGFTQCMASDCMWWKWEERALHSSLPESLSPVEISDINGYCGLAK